MSLLVEPAVAAGTMRDLPQPTLTIDDDLVLRPWEDDDAAVVRAAHDDPGIQRWHVRSFDDDQAARHWIRRWPEEWDAERGASWAVVHVELAVVGQVGLRTVSLFNGAAQASYWVVPAARHRGIAVRALEAATAWSFAAVGLHRMWLKHATANLASCGVARRAGFVAEGTESQSGLHADGWHDMHVHARLATDRDAHS